MPTLYCGLVWPDHIMPNGKDSIEVFIDLSRRVFLQAAAPAALVRQPVYLRDFRSVGPAPAVSNRWMQGRWRVLEYESDLGPGPAAWLVRNLVRCAVAARRDPASRALEERPNAAFRRI